MAARIRKPSCAITLALRLNAGIRNDVLPGFHPEMVVFRNLIVDLQDSLCDALQCVSAQSLDLLDLAKNLSFLNWKPASARKAFLDAHSLKQQLAVGPLNAGSEKQDEEGA
jgi:hypothetical protein